MPPDAPGRLLHATTVAIGGRGVLLMGPSGAGKSDLALRLIDRGAMLVADDYTLLSRDAAGWTAAPPATIAGRIEVRGIGIIALPYLRAAPIAIAVRLVTEVERMPERATFTLDDIVLPAHALRAFDASAALKVELALRETIA